MKLTPKQREFLTRALRHSYSDGSGIGAQPHDGHEVRTAMSLYRKGLVTVPVVWTAYTGSHITEAGRALLSQEADRG